jgi:hypothetical protein
MIGVTSNKKVYFSAAFKRMIHYVSKHDATYKDCLRRQMVVKAYCDLLKIEAPKKKKRDLFVIDEYFREGSPIFNGVKVEGSLPFKKKKKLKNSVKDLERRIANEKKKVDRRTEYNNYLNSNKWKTFRKKLIKERGNKCEKCSKENVLLHAHHLTYKRFMNELPEDILLVCVPCHDEIHGKKKKTA